MCERKKKHCSWKELLNVDILIWTCKSNKMFLLMKHTTQGGNWMNDFDLPDLIIMEDLAGLFWGQPKPKL